MIKYKGPFSIDQIETWIPYTRCVPHAVYFTHGNSKGEARRTSRHKNNTRVIRNLEEKNVGTRGKSSRQDPTSAKNLTIELPEGCASPYHRLF